MLNSCFLALWFDESCFLQFGVDLVADILNPFLVFDQQSAVKCFLVLVGGIDHPSCDHLLGLLGIGDVDAADGEQLDLVCHIDELCIGVGTHCGCVVGLQEFPGDLSFLAVFCVRGRFFYIGCGWGLQLEYYVGVLAWYLGWFWLGIWIVRGSLSGFVCGASCGACWLGRIVSPWTA